MFVGGGGHLSPLRFTTQAMAVVILFDAYCHLVLESVSAGMFRMLQIVLRKT